MTIPTHLELVRRLGAASTAADQKQILQSIKTEVIGHVEKKEQIVRHGILDIIKHILMGAERARGKRGQDELTNGPTDWRNSRSRWTIEEDVRLQAILLLGSLANGGTSFSPAIGASDTFVHLLSAISPRLNPPKTVVAALKAILAIADADFAADYCSYSPSPQCRCLPNLYSLSSVRSLAEVLAQRTGQYLVFLQIELAARLIKTTCMNDLQRNMLLDGGVLDLLAAQLAAHFVRLETWTNWDETRHGSSPAAELPPPGHEVAHILGALASIVHKSKYRAMRLVASPTVSNIFTISPPDSAERHRSIAGTAEYFELPRIPSPMRKNDEKNYPPLPSTHQNASAVETNNLDTLDEALDESQRRDACQSSLVTWLIAMVKNYTDLCRVEAANLLVQLCLSRAFQIEQPRVFSVVIIPCLIAILADTSGRTSQDQMRTKEQALFILADLIKPDPQLQKAAFDAGAADKISTILQNVCAPGDGHTAHWSPSRGQDEQATSSPSCRISPVTIPPNVVHNFRVREAGLCALAAVAASDDAARKSFTEKNMTKMIKNSMEPMSQFATATTENLMQTVGKEMEFGNPVPVLIAACNAGRVLARSVSLLRTSLIDAGMAAPTTILLEHSDVEVVKAATDFACNLNPEFSPIREDLVKAGVVKTLCAHSQSADSELCFRSLWALKHLIYQSPLDVKVPILEKLGTGRLKQLITSDPTAEAKQQFQEAIQQGQILDQTGHRRPGQDDSDLYANPDEPMDNEQQTAIEVRDTHRCSFNDHGDIIALDLLGYTGPRIPSEALRAKVYEAFNQDVASRYDGYMQTALALQLQSLDIIRNFIMGPKASDTVDFIFSRMQDPDLLDMVAEKIQEHRPSNLKDSTPSKAIAPALMVTQDEMQQDEESSVAQNTKLLYSAVMILTHIAAGSPQQRQKLISSRGVMSLMLSLLGHPDGTIRRSVVFCVTNLTWVDDDADRHAAVIRAKDLRNLGFVEALEARQNDENLDVRERINTARTQLYELLGLDGPLQGFSARREPDRDRRQRVSLG